MTVQNPTTPTTIAKELNTHLTHVSRTLRQFKERGLVECLTPEERMEKYYRITKVGKRILSEVENINK